jgi:ferric-dicitrate binding protein FerR (iron transport regulator)
MNEMNEQNHLQPEPGPEQRHLETLMVRYFDGTLDDNQLAELNSALATQPELRTAFNELCLQIVWLGEGAATDQAPPPVRRRKPWPVVFRWSAAAAILFAFVGLGFFVWSRIEEANSVRMANADGIVLIGEAGQERPAGAHHRLAAGEVISTVGPGSSVEFIRPDGVRVRLVGDSRATIPDSKLRNIQLDKGSLAAEVPEKKDFLIRTSDAEVPVREAKVAVSRAPTRNTSDGVSEQTVVAASAEEGKQGSVQVKRMSDGQSVSLPLKQGEWTVASARNLEPRKLDRPPDVFEFHCQNELPNGWGAGEIIHENLPPETVAAVRAVATPNRNGKSVNHVVLSNNAWTKGLFEIHEDSVFHVRFRKERPGFFHCLICTRGPDLADRNCIVLEHNGFWQVKKGEWITVDLPFKDFHPTEPHKPPVAKPPVAFVIVFDSQGNDAGLTIEGFWVTRGPGPKVD